MWARIEAAGFLWFLAELLSFLSHPRDLPFSDFPRVADKASPTLGHCRRFEHSGAAVRFSRLRAQRSPRPPSLLRKRNCGWRYSGPAAGVRFR